MTDICEKQDVGFLERQAPWVIFGILLASLDLIFLTRVLQFISTTERIIFTAQAYGIYLALTLILGNFLAIIVNGIGSRFLSEKVRRESPVAILFTLVISLVVMRETVIKLSLKDPGNIAALVLLLFTSSVLGVAFSRLVLFCIRSCFRALWITSLLLIFSVLFLPISSGTFAGTEKTSAPAASSNPNVILIVIDALRADHLGCYGAANILTPNIDRFSSKSTIFSNVHSHSSWTKTSVASLLTSRYPYDHDICTKEDVLDEKVPLLSTLLQQRGVLTSAFVGNPFLRSTFGFNRGYSLYFEEFNRIAKLYLMKLLYRRKLLTTPPYPDGAKILRYALQWITENRDTPFFTYIHLMDVHDPYLPPPPFERMYNAGDTLPADKKELLKMEMRFRHSEPPVDSSLLRLAKNLYSGGVSYEDSLVGDFLTFLDETGILDSSLVVITSDHGEEFFEHDGTTHGKTLYEEVLRVPLIVRYPEVFPQGLVVDYPVELIDVVPTILDIYGMEEQSSFEGTSLSRIIHEETEDEEFLNGRAFKAELYFGQRSVKSVKVGDWKLIIRNIEHNGSTERKLELYDLADDPYEQVDMSDIRADIVDYLSALLPKGCSQYKVTAEIPDELKDQLEALGYVTGQ